MQRYSFNIVRGKTVIPDPEEDTLRSDADAIQHASMVAREMIEGRHFYRGQHLERWAFEIADAAGRHIATVRLLALVHRTLPVGSCVSSQVE
jgi:hypothetical protein